MAGTANYGMPTGGGPSLAQDIYLRLRAETGEVRQALEQVKAQLEQVRQAMRQQNQDAAESNTLFERLNRLMSAFGVNLGDMIKLGAFGLMVHQLSEMVHVGDQFNRQLESITLGMKSVIASNIMVADSTGEQLDSVGKLEVAEGMVADQIAKLKTDALTTTATFSEMVSVFQSAIAPAMAMGASLDKTRELTYAMVQAAAAMGRPIEHVSMEMRMLLMGVVNIRTPMLRALGISTQQLQVWKQQGILIDEVLKRMGVFVQAGKEAGDTMRGVESTIQDFKEQLFGIITKGMFEEERKHLIEIRDAMGAVRNGVFVFNDSVMGVVATLTALFTGVARGVRGAEEGLVGLITTVKNFDQASGGFLRVLAAALALHSALNLLPTAINAVGWAMKMMAGSMGVYGATLVGLVALYAALKGAQAVMTETAETEIATHREAAKAAQEQAKEYENGAKRTDELAKAIEEGKKSGESDKELREEIKEQISDEVSTYPALLGLLSAESLERDKIATALRQQAIELERLSEAKKLAMLKELGQEKDVLERQRTQLVKEMETLRAGRTEGGGWSDFIARRRALMAAGRDELVYSPTDMANKMAAIDAKLGADIRKKAEIDAAIAKAGKETRAIEHEMAPEEDLGVAGQQGKTRMGEAAKVTGRQNEEEQRKKALEALKTADVQREVWLKQDIMEIDNKLADVEERRRLAALDMTRTIEERQALEREELDIKSRATFDKAHLEYLDKVNEKQAKLAELEKSPKGQDPQARAQAELKADQEIAEAKNKMERAAEENEIKRRELQKKQLDELRKREQEVFDHRKKLGEVSEYEETMRLRQKLQSPEEAERWKAEEELYTKTKTLEESLFNYRKAIGVITLEMEIGRQKAIAANAQKTGQERMDAEKKVFELEQQLQDKRLAAADKVAARAKEQMQYEGTYDEGMAYSDADLAAAEERWRTRKEQRLYELQNKGAMTETERAEMRKIQGELKEKRGEEREVGTGGQALGETRRAQGFTAEQTTERANLYRDQDELRTRIAGGDEAAREQFARNQKRIAEIEAAPGMTESQQAAAEGQSPAATAVRDAASALGLASLPTMASTAFTSVATSFSDLLTQMEQAAAKSGAKITKFLYQNFVDQLKLELKSDINRT